MNRDRRSYKLFWAVSIAVVLVLVILFAFLFENRSGTDRESIVLPDPPSEVSVQKPTEQPPADDFVQVSADNVLSILQSMSRPSSYHQVYSVTVGVDETQALRQVELWINGSLIHAEIFDGARTKTILTDGETAYLWYDGDTEALYVPLEQTVLPEDLMGLLSPDYLLSIAPEQITDADFLVLEDPKQVQCLYVCSQDAEYVTSRYWIDLGTGLLYKADVLELSKQVYVLKQDSFEQLAAEDEAFSDRFILPDGSTPFSTAAEMPQP